MQWKDDTDDRATLTRRYLEGGPAAIHPAGASENVEAAEISGCNEGGETTEAGRADDTGDSFEASPEPAADAFEPSLRGAAIAHVFQATHKAFPESIDKLL